MKSMHIDCSMGAAGDMLTAALLELLPENEQKGFIDVFNALEIPGVVMEAEPSVKCGVSGTLVRMKVHGEEEGHTHHGHDMYSHAHRHMEDIEHIINGLDVSAKVRADILNVYKIIADAESKAHGVPVAEVHFHEVGAMDAIADITAACMLMDRIGADLVTASSVNVGAALLKALTEYFLYRLRQQRTSLKVSLITRET